MHGERVRRDLGPAERAEHYDGGGQGGGCGE